MKQGDKVEIIGGNFEDKDWLGYIGEVKSIEENTYKVNGKDTRMVYVKLFDRFHCFNDYHLKVVNIIT